VYTDDSSGNHLVKSPCMASPAGQTNQRRLRLSRSVHKKTHLGLS